MTPHFIRNSLIAVLIACLTAACAVPPREPQPDAGTPPDRSGTMNSPAVVELSSSARRALNERRFDQASHFLERAIRIEPRNGGLWHELARVRFEQGDYEQARQLATRSNALLNNDAALRAKNDELIDAARQALSY